VRVCEFVIGLLRVRGKGSEIINACPRSLSCIYDCHKEYFLLMKYKKMLGAQRTLKMKETELIQSASVESEVDKYVFIIICVFS
jgi:hypothetical protein